MIAVLLLISIEFMLLGNLHVHFCACVCSHMSTGANIKKPPEMRVQHYHPSYWHFAWAVKYGTFCRCLPSLQLFSAEVGLCPICTPQNHFRFLHASICNYCSLCPCSPLDDWDENINANFLHILFGLVYWHFCKFLKSFKLFQKRKCKLKFLIK